jgi:hypothetical protein
MKRRKITDQIYDYGTHEVLHLASVSSDIWSDHILDHPRVKENKAWKEQAQKALDEMFRLYQMIGATA